MPSVACHLSGTTCSGGLDIADLGRAAVFVLSDEEAERALQATLQFAGVASYEELEAQARSGRFASTRASDAWYAIPPGWANS